MDSKDLSIAIVTCNVEPVIVPCLLSIFKSCGRIASEILIVDNHSSDETVSRITSNFPQLRLLINEQNAGFAKAANQAINNSIGRYILLLNPDTEVIGDTLERMIRFMDQNPEAGVLGPLILNPDLSIQGSARSFPDISTAFFGRSSLFTQWFPKNRFTQRNVLCLNPKVKEAREVDWVSGAAMMVRREALKQVGLLDEFFFLFWEDADLCFRMKQAGWKSFYYPEAVIIHKVGESVKKLRKKSIIEFHKSALRWYLKHGVNSRRSPKKIFVGACLYTRMILKLFALFFESFVVERKEGVIRGAGDTVESILAKENV